MSKTICINVLLDSYQSFFDHGWFEEKTEETRDSALYQLVFDLGKAWRYAANTHVLPWFLTTTVKAAAETRLNTTEPFGKKYITDVCNLLVREMGESLRNMQKKKLHGILERIYEKSCEVPVPVEPVLPDEIWQMMLKNSEFRFSIVGSQRLSYGAVYYAYEDFLCRCIGLAKGKANFRIYRKKDFQKEIKKEFGAAVCTECWDDIAVNLARVTRHALVHNGCRVTDELKQALEMLNNPLLVEDGEIQITAPDTTMLFRLLKDRANRIIAAALKHPNIGSFREEDSHDP
jgi:hypothetical protein